MNNVQRRAIAMLNAFEADSNFDKKRADKARKLIELDLMRSQLNLPTDSGVAGKVAEILGHDSDSTIIGVQKQGATDLYVIIDGKRTKCEYKTNGGRIESLYRVRKPEASYIVYELDFTPAPRKLKDGTVVYSERRYAKKLMTVADFLSIIEDTKAVKVASHKGQCDAERAVQCSSKKLYNALMNGNFTDYDRNKTYLSDRI